MNVLEWFLGSQVLPAGAIDVVAIRHDDGSLLCSPFHIKLGKASKKGEKKIVKLRVNGKEVDVWMKLGPAGEAFFVERTKELRREGLSSSYLEERSLLSPAFDEDKLADIPPFAATSNPLSNSVDDVTRDSIAEPMYTLEENDVIRLDPDFRAVNLSGKKGVLRDRSFSENDATLSTPGYTASSIMFPILEDSLQMHSSHSNKEYTAPSSGSAMRRERSKSDMSLLDLRLDKAVSPFPKSESSKSLDKILSATTSEKMTTDGISGNNNSNNSTAKKDDVSWIWRWGYLPVKTAPPAAVSAHSADFLSQAESKDAAMSLSPRLVSSEVRETADDEPHGILSSPAMSPSATRRSIAHSKESLNTVMKSPPRAFASLDDLVGTREDVDNNNLNVLTAEALQKHECSLFNAADGDEDVDYVAPGKSSRVDCSAEYRVGLDDSLHRKEDVYSAAMSHKFSALSKCGHLLNLSATNEDFPATSEQLLELLYAHRLTSADFVSFEHMSLDYDQNVVVIVDDFLLTLNVANILFAAVGLDAHGHQEEKGSVASLQVNEASIQQAIQSYYRNTDETGRKPVLPAWAGKRISTWAALDERAGRDVPHAYDQDCFEEPQDASVDHQHHLSLMASPGEKEFSTPMSSLKEGVFSSHPQDSLTYVHSSSKINALDFESWKNSALGWRESFADLMQAYKYQSHVHSTTRSNEDLAGILADATSRDNSHQKAPRESWNSAEDDYFLRSHDDEDSLHLHSTPFKTYQDSQHGEEAMEECSPSSTVESAELNKNPSTTNVDFESASKTDHPVNGGSRFDRMSTIAEEELEGETDGDHLSLQDIALEDISPEPAGGDFYESDTESYLSLSLDDGETGKDDRNADDKDVVRRPRYRRYRYRKALVPSKEQLDLLGLLDGENEISFEVEGCAPVVAQAYVWPANAKVVVADLEGVVISSSRPAANNVWSSFLGASTPKTSVVEEIVKLLNDVESRGYKILFFSQATNVGHSKDYLSKFSAARGLKLPPAPIFKSPDSLIQAFGASRTEVFKASALRGLRGLFPSYNNPYHAAFVNKPKDVVAFERNHFPEGRIFILDDKLQLRCCNRTSAMSLKDFSEMSREIFPDQIVNKVSDTLSPRNTLKSVEDEYCDFNYWKVPLPPIDDLP